MPSRPRWSTAEAMPDIADKQVVELCLGHAARDGAQGRNRTTDTAILSRMLYQLSYLGAPSRPKVQTRWRRGT